MTQKHERPLSPHLQIYRWQLPMLTSILHRFTGVALAVGTLMVAWMLLAAATGPAAWGTFVWFCGTPVGLFMLFGWSVTLFYHMANGVRHLIWDAGYLFKLKNAYRAGYVVLAFTALMTAATWGHVFWQAQGKPQTVRFAESQTTRIQTLNIVNGFEQDVTIQQDVTTQNDMTTQGEPRDEQP